MLTVLGQSTRSVVVFHSFRSLFRILTPKRRI